MSECPAANALLLNALPSLVPSLHVILLTCLPPRFALLTHRDPADSDSFGRVGPFCGTLLLTSCFGILAGFAGSFTLLCLCFFALGLGVGGSMPTDGGSDSSFVNGVLRNRPLMTRFLCVVVSQAHCKRKSHTAGTRS